MRLTRARERVLLLGSEILSGLTELVFPRYCLICDRFAYLGGNPLVCHPCLLRLIRAKPPMCYRCGRINPDKKPCYCLRHPDWSIDWHRSFGVYKKTLRDLLLQYKTKNQLLLSDVFAGLILSDEDCAYQINTVDLIVAVPSNPLNLRRRGYSASGRIAMHLGRKTNTAVWQRALYRQPGPSQSSMRMRSRHSNARLSLSLRSSLALPKRILLADDVITSGETLAECARLLKQAGAERIVAVTVAQAP